jgi:putative nucleotidyltransferase with HDIG domain
MGPAAPGPPSTRKLADSVIEELWFGDDDPLRSHLVASNSLAAAAALATGLRPFPAIAHRVLERSRDPDVAIEDVKRLIEKDVALAARVLRIANSAVYSMGQPCATIERALVRLGLRNTAQVVVSLLAHGMFDHLDPIGVRVRDHCLGVAAIARVLATEWRCADVDDVFLCGLMHDVGKLLAMQVHEIDYATLEHHPNSSPDTTHFRERMRVGWDHAVLGAHVLEAWRLPRNVSTIVAWHHQPGRAYAAGGGVATSVALLRIADHAEYQIRSAKRMDPAFLRAIERDTAIDYVGRPADAVLDVWPRLVAAVEESTAAAG